jgi:hypothetical protein
MKIPEILSTVGIPSSIPYGHIPENPIGGALAQAGQQLEHVANVFEQKAEAANNEESDRLANEADKELVDEERKLQLSPDYATYEKRYGEIYDRISGKKILAASNGAVKNRLSAYFDRTKPRDLIKAGMWSDQKLIERDRATMQERIDIYKNKAAMESDPDAFVEHLEEIKKTIWSRVPRTLTEDAAQKLEHETMAGISETRLIAHGMIDPRGAAELLEKGYYKEIEPIRRMSYIESLRNKADQMDRQREIDEAKRQKEVEQATIKKQNDNMNDMIGNMYLGAVPLDQIYTAKDNRDIPQDKFEHLLELHRTLAERGAKGIETPSNPELLQRMTLDIYSTRPKTTEIEIDRAVIAHVKNPGTGLELKDAKALKEKLVSYKRWSTEQADQDTRRQETDAHEILMHGLTTRGPLEEFDPVAGATQTMALEEFRKRVIAGESPMAVTEDILPRYRRVLFKQGTLSVENSKKLLAYPTLTELDQAYADKKISQSTYRMQKQLFLSIYQREQEADQLADEKARESSKTIKR